MDLSASPTDPLGGKRGTGRFVVILNRQSDWHKTTIRVRARRFHPQAGCCSKIAVSSDLDQSTQLSLRLRCPLFHASYAMDIFMPWASYLTHLYASQLLDMGLINTVSKLIPTAGLITGPMMLAAGLLGRIHEMPAAFMKANDGTGADKAEWAADLLGTTRTNVFILLGVCKVLALLDLWLLHVVQRVSNAKALRSQQPRRPQPQSSEGQSAGRSGLPRWARETTHTQLRRSTAEADSSGAYPLSPHPRCLCGPADRTQAHVPVCRHNDGCAAASSRASYTGCFSMLLVGETTTGLQP